ncbi:23S rRNA (uracil1939-C5)-methyltransferase [Marinitoga hydrogenitolerans DSM 16785]|uniref:23S rRNA (Uracil1939-C5)-methyltransferase n=1 Tax=Marinitoga hydrogenitolerans (strain DSM 16785 / JCM 12826 / AT1271) TaxID=1122195 RepID=A0A1M4WAM8_MARH1|nr:23S rRNA (uracil(1939)-C(5))-methyltransferase RlmD [Marinitoga hydrogenitolerans]SHE78294.1 23S rRNA (uracil1939-C5)-methyltransferase [Marinitoga hydrogenitolerans DSM 16785]
MEFIDVVVEKIVNGGYGFARYDNRIYMIEHAYPGEFVKIKIKGNKKDVYFAEVVEYLEKSPYRNRMICPYFQKCGGCQLLDLDYKEQLKIKTNIVKEQVRRIGKLDDKLVIDAIGSDEIINYRNKMEFSFAYDRGEIKLGLKKRNSNEIINVKKCLIAPKEFNKIINETKKIFEALNLKIYNPKSKKGEFKHLVLRKSFSKNEIMSIFITKTEYITNYKNFKSLIKERIKSDSIIHVMNGSDSIVLRGPYKTLKGEGVIKEEFDGFTFQIPPTAFFQNNYNVTKKILNEFVKIVKSEKITGNLLDLYSGVGLFSIYLAPLFKHVTGVESNGISVKAAHSNANINGIKNTSFIKSDVQEFIKEYDKRIDLLIIDPPRSGVSKEVLTKILQLKPKNIFYLSCDSTTLARDLSNLKKTYNIEFIRPFDMFPNTFHIENFAFLKVINSD